MKKETDAITINSSGSYITGIFGAIIGGIIASIPWILSYVYANMILSVLSLIIGFGAYYGYKILKGKIDKKLPIIISIITVLCVVFSTLIIIPLLLLNKEGLDATLGNLNLLYSFAEFRSAIIKDLLISIIFAILGISGLYKKLKKEI